MILTVTRACDLRCAYCPTAKDGWPSLTPADARRAVSLFADQYGGGDLKLFGGEPLLVPEVVRAAMEAARSRPEIRRVYLSTNGLGLTPDWIAYLRGYRKGILTISMDGSPEDHRRMRRAQPGVADAYDHLMALRPQLRTLTRLVITQTIPPTTAGRAADNLRHLLSLGFFRFNLLPGYYIPWKAHQLTALAASFDAIQDLITARWRSGRHFYLRNLFTRAPTPFFNTGFVVDADRTIHPSNIGLSGTLDHLRSQTAIGTLDAPPSPAALADKAATVNGLLEANLSEKVWQSTLAVDAELTRLCRSLYPALRAYRRRRGAA
ncbi:MAG: radical SAM protein [Myxococcota bacterium]|nr:radical SAM protein [Myxococcota bacterium]